ncbi:MAG: chemotaxis protein CheX [Desulfobacterales bacterium]|jgi:chemotaxis protein CheX|nr:chemotaxis protein CheX [Desulfobacterales bacterium]
MDAKRINPVIQAIVDILEKVGALSIKIQKPFVKSNATARGEITSIIVLRGDVSGTVSITFPTKCILSVVSKMLGEQMTELNEDIKDALGEITNMISGQATQLFEMTGQSLKASLSQVIVGKNHTIPHASDATVLGVPCQSEHGEITLEMCFEEEF